MTQPRAGVFAKLLRCPYPFRMAAGVLVSGCLLAAGAGAVPSGLTPPEQAGKNPQADRDPHGEQVVTVGHTPQQAGILRLWDVPSGRLLRTFGNHPCAAGCFSPDGSVLATLGTSQPGGIPNRTFANTISLWDLATGQRLRS